MGCFSVCLCELLCAMCVIPGYSMPTPMPIFRVRNPTYTAGFSLVCSITRACVTSHLAAIRILVHLETLKCVCSVTESDRM